ncbi:MULTISPECIES: YihY/virulence factor BrkB family protein [unclassified Massilia]|uniref:YihY/virulence factor BrkB family protein n=1 Tax=unclassified Massilia TaxID=2609279 RepID=UPI001E59E94D|nr:MULTISPECIES: YihY/virulence factor BrkB family protein [unclassified Massilia]
MMPGGRLRVRRLRVRILNRRANAYILSHPLAFTLSVLKGFRANQGLLLAGAVAYYALLSIVPFLMLVVVVLSHFLDQAELLVTMRRYLELLVPGQSVSIVAEVANFLDNRDLITWVLAVTMLFFSSFAFTVLENAMSVIFIHRVAIRRRHFLVSAVLPYCYILALGFGVMLVTLVAGTLQVMGRESVQLLGITWSLGGLSGALLYLLGLAGEILVLTSIYLVMPVGRLSLSHALVGGVTAALLWEVARHVLVWYFSTLSQVNVVYGSMTTAIVVMFSLEIGATLLLFGAQVIAEYERVGRGKPERHPPLSTEPV